MELYHGTDKSTAENIVSIPNFIDRRKGGGELGMGFYTSNNPFVVAIWAKGRFGESDASVVEFEINNNSLLKLDVYLVKKRDKVYNRWRQILSLRQRLTYLFNRDIVMAPFAIIDVCIQYKFESQDAEDLINDSKKKLAL